MIYIVSNHMFAHSSGLKSSMHLLILWFRVWNTPDDAIIQYKPLNLVYFDHKTRLYLLVPVRHEKYIFGHTGFYPPDTKMAENACAVF